MRQGNPLFLTEHHPGVKFSKDYQPEKNGYPKGVKNRSTVIRQVLEMLSVLPDATFEKLKEVLPGIERNMSAESVLTLSVLSKAIEKGDGYLYAQLMDSAYGKPKQEMEIDNKITIEINIL